MAHTSGKEQSLADRRELQRGRRVHSAHQISGKALWVRSLLLAAWSEPPGLRSPLLARGEGFHATSFFIQRFSVNQKERGRWRAAAYETA